MVGNGIQSTNVFAALDSLRRKKKSDSTKGKGLSKSGQAKEQESPVIWTPAPLTSTSWADVDDDDDYYATTAPFKTSYVVPQTHQSHEETAVLHEEEETDSEVDYGDEGVDDEPEVLQPVEPVVKNATPYLAPPKEAERQLSKKELKKKELAELEAVLAEFGLTEKENYDNIVDAEEKKSEQQSVGENKKESNGCAPTESKTSKKKKKKDKASKEKDSLEVQANIPAKDILVEASGSGPAEDDSSTVDLKERLKKIASTKKKKSSKEMDAAAKAATQEAAARNAKLAAAKKKEKNHYNQQPVR